MSFRNTAFSASTLLFSPLCGLNSFIKERLSTIKVRARTLRPIFVAAICGVMLGVSTAGTASSIVGEYDLDIRIADPIGTRIHRVMASTDLAYSFAATVQSPTGALPINVDIYFGALAPGGKALSWVKSGASFTVVSGLEPLTTTVNLVGGDTFDTGLMLGGDIRQSFPLTGPKGMYTVFAILVRAGMDAANPDNWIAVTMSPLFVE